MGPGDDLALPGIFRREKIEFLPDGKIPSKPESGQGGKIVSAGHHQGLTRIILSWPELAIFIFFEVKDSVGQDPHGSQGLPDLLRDGTEILPYDQALIPLALQGENPQKVIKVVMDVSAFKGLHPGRNPEEPHEAHDMIDA
jgi:hypothetical protein